MKKIALILAVLMLVTLCACKRMPDTEEYVEKVDRPTPSVQPEQEQQTPTKDETDNQIHLQNQPADKTPEPEYDYSEQVDYFKDSHEFWNGESEGATLVSANCPQNDITMSMYIPKGWCYKTVDFSSEKTDFGIYFWPEGEENGKIYVSFNIGDRELGCGTGIDFKDIRLGKFDATVVTYVTNDINPYMWNHISILNKTNSVKIRANDAYLWWHKYYDTAIKIMSSLNVTENICSTEQAIEAVCKYKGVDEFTASGCEYDFENNQWIVSELDRINKSMIRYTVSADVLNVELVG